MPYIKRIVCLAASYKAPGGRCIAGIELLPGGGHGGWIRPVSARPKGELSLGEYHYQCGGDPALLDILDIPLLQPAPQNPQSENHLIDPIGWWNKRGQVTCEQLRDLKNSPNSLWANGGHTVTGVNDCVCEGDAAKFKESLFLLEIDGLTIQIGTLGATGNRPKRCAFTYRGTTHSFSLTDPAVCLRLASLEQGEYPFGNVYLCISLTLPYIDHRCHKLVAALIPEKRMAAALESVSLRTSTL